METMNGISFSRDPAAHHTYYDDSSGHSPPPPAYTSLPEAIAAGMQSLMVGDPNEEISVPMIHSIEQKRKRDLFLPGGRNGIVTRTVLVRKMAREHYLKHYAKDAQGNYIGTAQPAPDAGLVFVPGKSTDQDILEQVRKVAFGKEHSNQYFVVSVRDCLFLEHVLSSSRVAGRVQEPVEERCECIIP